MLKPLRVLLPVLALVFLLPGARPAAAQCVSLTTLGSAYTQNFDTLSNVAGSTTNNLTITGWFLTESGGGARDNEQYGADNGNSNTGDTYSYGATGSTERALGGLLSGTLVPLFGACFTNNTGSTITSLAVAYTGEEWRLGTTARTDRINFEYSTNATDLVTGTWTGVGALNFLTPDIGTTGLKDGNTAGERTALSSTISSLSIANGATFWIHWTDTNSSGADDGLAVDDFSLTPQGSANAPVVPSCPASLATVFGTATSAGVSASDADGTVTSAAITGITPSNPGTITLTGFTPAGGVGGTANATLDVSNTTPAGSYNVTIQWANNDPSPQTATCVVAVSVTAISKIHDVQGNGAATPIPGSTVTVEGVVTASFQGTTKLRGFFLQEEDADADADPATSEGIFVFCGSCPTPVAEGQRVKATGAVSEFNNMTEITASTAPSVVVTDAGNHLAEVTPSPVDLPIAGVVDDFYEAREGMKVTFVDTLTVSEYFELGRYGQIILYEGGRPRQFTEVNAPSVAGNAAWADTLSRRQVILDDDNNTQEWYLATSSPAGPADGFQYVYHPRANGGFSAGTQGTDFFRGGDLVNGLTGILHWDFPGFGSQTWRIRPTNANPAAFTVANPRPATPPAVSGAIHAVGMNLLNYFTTIDTTSSNSTGPCSPSGTLDCRGADSVAELNRQRERASIVICTLNADVYGFAELENTTPSDSITDLLGAVNALCGGAHPYAFVNTGGTLGTDAIRVQQIYRTGIVSPVGSPLSDLDPIHSRPPTAQTYDVVDATNPAFGQRFTVVVNHLKSKGSSAGLPGDADVGDGAGASNATRTAQANRLLTWINGTVIPAAGDPDVLLLGDFNSYAKEDPINAIVAGGYTDLEALFQGANAYSYLFDGQLGHLDYGFASSSLLPQVTGADAWHINADEVDLFDYNDEVRDSPGEATFEEKPDGSALVPPRVVFQPGTPYRASDHDPVLVGLFAVADLSVTKTDGVTTAVPGGSVTYTITASNAGPDPVTGGTVADTFPASLTCTWTCVGAGGGTCTASGSGNLNDTVNLPAGGSVTYTASCTVSASATGTLSNTATVAAPAGVTDPTPGNDSATDSDTLAASADLSVTKVDTPDPVSPGGNVTYTITVSNAGPSDATSVALSDTLPAGTTFVSLASPGGWSCTTPAVGANGTVSCSIATLAPGNAVFTLVAAVSASVADGTTLSNSATVTSATTDPVSGDESGTATTDVRAGSADLSVTKVDTPDPVTPGSNLTYTITVTNAGPDSASSVTLSDNLPAGTTFVSLSSPGGWSCSTPAVGSGGMVSCSIDPLAVGSAVFTLVVAVDPSVNTDITNIASVASTTPDPEPKNEIGVATTAVAASADLSVTKVDNPDPVAAGTNLTYTITVTNAGPNNAANVFLTDTLPAGTTFQSLSTPGGWSCSTPVVGSAGSINCSNTSMAPGSPVFTLTVHVGSGLADGTVLSNTADVSSSTPDPNTGNESATASTTVTNSVVISATKTAGGDFTPGGTVTYTIVLTNTSGLNQADNPGSEFTDVLPAQLTLVSASATSGMAVATVATNTVTWDGAIAGGTSVTITIQATVKSNVAPGTLITNQGTVAYDADGNGTNESTASTDDPGASGPNNPTTFTVAGGQAITEIPTLDEIGLALLTLLLALGGASVLRRRRARS